MSTMKARIIVLVVIGLMAVTAANAAEEYSLVPEPGAAAAAAMRAAVVPRLTVSVIAAVAYLPTEYIQMGAVVGAYGVATSLSSSDVNHAGNEMSNYIEY
jgi:hypothetical protein